MILREAFLEHDVFIENVTIGRPKEHEQYNHKGNQIQARFAREIFQNTNNLYQLEQTN